MKNLISSIELSALYKVSIDSINNGIQQGDLIVENGKITLKEFRAWCNKHHIESETKKCSVCGKDLPLYHYGRHIHHNDGLATICLECKKNEKREKMKVEIGKIEAKKQSTPEKIALSTFSHDYHLTEVETIRLYTFITRREVTAFSLDSNDSLIDRKTAEWFLVGAFDFKRCPRCGKIKRFSEYHTNNKLWHGRQHWCKDCITKYGQNRRDDVKEKKQADADLDAVFKKYPHLKEQMKRKVLTF